MRRSRIAAVTTAAVLVIAGTGCGDDSVGIGAIGASPTEDSLEATVRQLGEGLFGGDMSARDLWSSYTEECRSQSDFDDFAGLFLLGMGMMESIYGDNVTVAEVQVRNFSPEHAEALLVIAADGEVIESDEDEWDSYTFANGKWQITDCEDLNPDLFGDDSDDDPVDTYDAAVEEWNALSQDERDSWYDEDGSGGFERWAEANGYPTELS
jgi:hypothetical protein